MNPASAEQFDRGGDGGLVQPSGDVVQGVPGAGGGQEQRGEQVLGGGAPQVAAVLVGDGQHEMPGQPVGVLDGAQPAQQVPPPGLRLVGDALRVEQPHPPAGARGAQRGGGGPQVGLVGGGDHRAGRGQHERDRLRGRLARPGCHERHHGVFPRRVHRRPAPAARAHQPSERQPGLGRVHRRAGRRRPATGAGLRRAAGDRPAGSVPASAGCGPAPRPGHPAPAAAGQPPATTDGDQRPPRSRSARRR